MNTRIYPELEHPIEGFEISPEIGKKLIRIIESHAALAPLMDFYYPDPAQIAIEVGMTYALDAEDADELEDIDFGEPDWYEPAAGLAVIQKALNAVREEPQSVAAAIYDPSLTVRDVMDDLAAIENVLLMAQQHETRFHFSMAQAPEPNFQ